MELRVGAERQVWPLRRPFGTAREVQADYRAIVIRVGDGKHQGQGEAAGVDYRGETPDSMIEDLQPWLGPRSQLPAREALIEVMPAGGARNALDCALWDLTAKQTGAPVWRLAGLPEPRPLETAFTIGLAAPETMAGQARATPHAPILKLKLGGGGDDDARVAAVREVAPSARLIVDANEGWSLDQLQAIAPRLAEFGVELIEQPLPAGSDDALAGYRCPVPLCADESCDTIADLPRLTGRYQFVNIKLDKAGGFTASLELARAAQASGMGVMVGCMLGTSLAMAPAFLLAQTAAYVDLDGPLLQSRDVDPSIRYEGFTMHPPDPRLWG